MQGQEEHRYVLLELQSNREKKNKQTRTPAPTVIVTGFKTHLLNALGILFPIDIKYQSSEFKDDLVGHSGGEHCLAFNELRMKTNPHPLKCYRRYFKIVFVDCYASQMVECWHACWRVSV